MWGRLELTGERFSAIEVLRRDQLDFAASQAVAESRTDETSLEETLDSRIGYDNPLARVRDVDSLSAIIRLRRGGQPSNIEDSKALFVTTNIEIVRAAGDYVGATALPGTIT